MRTPKRLFWIHVKDLDLSNIDPNIVASKNAARVKWHLDNEIASTPHCINQNCNNEVKWKAGHGYQTFCSRKCSAQNESIKQQKKNTCEQKYGVSNPSKNTEIKQKIKDTTNKRFGVDHPLQNDDIMTKTKNTNIAKYGVSSYSQTAKFKELVSGDSNPNRQRFSQDTLDILNSKSKFNSLADGKSIYELSDALEKFDISTLRKYIHQYDSNVLLRRSQLEHEMADFLNDLDVKFIQNERNIISPQELDFYLPDHNIAIEMNGIYWHSEKFISDKFYHYNKWKSCHDNDIHLISIFEDLWINHPTKVKQALISLLGLRHSPVIGARKLQIMQINATIARPFLNKYHLQNFVNGTHFAAFNYQMQPMAIMTFGMSRNQHFELKRFSTNGGNFPGVASKLFKYARQQLAFDKVVSFSDNTWFTGKMYEHLGFDFENVIQPSYKYFYKGNLVHCSTFTKQNIVRKFPYMKEAIDNGMTEKIAMQQLDIPRVWDCGKKKWLWTDRNG